MYAKIKSTKSQLLDRLATDKVEVGIILGSGLGALAERVGGCVSIPYSEIENFPRSTVEGHSGVLHYGIFGGRRAVVLQGRAHYYEGYSMEQVAFPARLLCALGIDTLVVTNAAGGVNPDFEVGDLMVIDDHINLLPNPLIGANDDSVGARFPEMTTAYDARLRQWAHDIDNNLRSGVYLASSGPTFETPAEYRYFRTIGADACGMSTTPEVIVARHAGVRVFGVSMISNIGFGSRAGIASHKEVFEAAAAATPRLISLVEGVVENI